MKTFECDEQELTALEEQQTNELIAAPPYPDLHTDIYEVFDDFPAYERNKDRIEACLDYLKNR